MRKPKLFIVTANSQPWAYSDYMWSVFETVLSYKGPVSICRGDSAREDMRQNSLIESFLASDADIMVKMDVDQEYPIDYLNLMAPLALKYKVIGPEIYDRWEVNKYGILCFGDKNDLINTHIDCSDESGIKSYPYTHTNNFYMREVVEAVPLPWYHTKYNETRTAKAAHNDYDLLDKIKDAGYKIYLNHDVEVNHLFIGKANRRLHKIYVRGNHGIT